jgi:hypothetical protein
MKHLACLRRETPDRPDAQAMQPNRRGAGPIARRHRDVTAQA